MLQTAIVTGITGQDGQYLSELLMRRGYRVIGLTRRPSGGCERPRLHETQPRVAGGRVEILPFDLDDQASWDELLTSLQPAEIYHLGGVSFVPDSWHDPVGTVHANVDVTLHILESIHRYSPATRLFFAASSEIFGRPETGPQNERTPLQPISPYGVTKTASHLLIDVYRRRYGLFACSGILFNHESPLRPVSFVTRKITAAAAAIATGRQDRLQLGNLDTCRDWGYAGDFVDCMWRMLQAPAAKDYVIGTGRLTSIRQLLDYAFASVDLDWRRYVSCDPGLNRPQDAAALYADATAAESDLGWRATTDTETLIRMMVRHDLQSFENSGLKKMAA